MKNIYNNFGYLQQPIALEFISNEACSIPARGRSPMGLVTSMQKVSSLMASYQKITLFIYQIKLNKIDLQLPNKFYLYLNDASLDVIIIRTVVFSCEGW